MKKRDSFIVYKSFIEAAQNLDDLDRLEYYDALFLFGFEHKESELKPINKALFALIRPQLEANYKRYQNACKRKANREQNRSKTRANDNENDNENDNDNENELASTSLSLADQITYDSSLNPSVNSKRREELRKRKRA